MTKVNEAPWLPRFAHTIGRRRADWLRAHTARLPPLDRIVPAHIAYVLSVLRRYSIIPRQDREDLLQQVLLEAYQSRNSSLPVRALLFGIARHTVFRHRAKHHAEPLVFGPLPSPGPTISRTPEDDCVVADLRRTTHAALSALPSNFREVYLRAMLFEATMPQITRDLGIPLNTGYTRVPPAQQLFRAALARHLARARTKKEDLL